MMGITVKNSDLVLEVGSGDFPSYRADVLLDKYPSDNFQRNKDIWIDDRLFIVADAHKLPFRDKAFDYVIAANILPYVDKPEVFFSELMRVAPAGLILAISELFERLRDIPFHKWYVNLADNKLILREKKDVAREFGRLFHILCEKDSAFLKFLNKHWFIFNLTYKWQERINYEIAPPERRILDLEDVSLVESLIQDKRKKIIQILNSLIPYRLKSFILNNSAKFKRKKGRKIELLAFLVCPHCRKDVKINKDKVECLYCKKSYPVKNGIPYMLDE